MELYPLGDSAVLIQLGRTIDAATHARVRAVCERLEAGGVPGMTETVPAFAAVAVFYDPAAVARAAQGPPFERVRAALAERLAGLEAADVAPGPVVEIPACYCAACGPDLDAVARRAGLERGAAAELHAGAEYTVHMVGFAPGFPYLGGLPERLATPRRAEPRLVVPAGSVGIAGAQTGIYPIETPGGWNLIGRTPCRLFDPAADPPTRLRLGDRVRFRPVAHGELGRWREGPWR